MANKTENKLLIKNYWFWAVLVVGGVSFLFFRFELPVSVARQSSLVLDFGNGVSRKFQGPAIPGMTILETIYAASANNDLDFRYSIDENGVLKIAKIGNVVNLTDAIRWNFYLNGRSINGGDINRAIIRAGDRIDAKYE